MCDAYKKVDLYSQNTFFGIGCYTFWHVGSSITRKQADLVANDVDYTFQDAFNISHQKNL